MPVITGLYTIVLPVILFALLGSSRHLVVGADSASAAIMFAGLAGLATVASPQYVALAGMTALMVGAFLLLARILRLGFLADFLSRTVLIGFLTGVGIQVACGQFSGLFGIPKSGSGPIEQVVNTFKDWSKVSWTTFAVSAAVIFLIVVGGKLLPRIPWALIAVIGASSHDHRSLDHATGAPCGAPFVVHRIPGECQPDAGLPLSRPGTLSLRMPRITRSRPSMASASSMSRIPDAGNTQDSVAAHPR